MKQAITFIINGKTYSFSAGNIDAIGTIRSADRQQLMTLLEAVKSYERRSQAVVQQAVEKVRTASRPLTNVDQAGGQQLSQSERLTAADTDALVARLMLEEKRSQKPVLTKKSLYKFVAGFAALVIVLILVF